MHMAAWGKELGGERVKGRRLRGTGLALPEKATGSPSGPNTGLQIREKGEKASLLLAVIQLGVSCSAQKQPQ